MFTWMEKMLKREEATPESMCFREPVDGILGFDPAKPWADETVVLHGGRRAGKITAAAVAKILDRAVIAPYSNHAIFAGSFKRLKYGIISTALADDLERRSPDFPLLKEMLNRPDSVMTLPNGSRIWFIALSDDRQVDKFLGLEFVTGYFSGCSDVPEGYLNKARSRLIQRVEGMTPVVLFD